MKLKIMKNLVGIFICLSVFILSVYSYADSSETTVNLEIEWWEMNIYAPDLLDFGTGTVLTVNTFIEVDLLTYSWWTLYFAVEDLKASDSWYAAYLAVSDLTTNLYWSWTISKDNIFITLSWANSWITLLWWTLWIPPEIIIPNSITDTVLWQTWWVLTMFRTSPVDWIVWKYWFQPKIKILVPRYQQVWGYQWLMTFTLLEY